MSTPTPPHSAQVREALDLASRFPDMCGPLFAAMAKEIGTLRAALRYAATMLEDAGQQALIPSVARFAAEQARVLAGDTAPVGECPVCHGASRYHAECVKREVVPIQLAPLDDGSNWRDVIGDGVDEDMIGGRW